VAEQVRRRHLEQPVGAVAAAVELRDPLDAGDGQVLVLDDRPHPDRQPVERDLAADPLGQRLAPELEPEEVPGRAGGDDDQPRDEQHPDRRLAGHHPPPPRPLDQLGHPLVPRPVADEPPAGEHEQHLHAEDEQPRQVQREHRRPRRHPREPRDAAARPQPPQEAPDVQRAEQPERHVHLRVARVPEQVRARRGQPRGEQRGADADDLPGEEVHRRDHQRPGDGGDEAHPERREEHELAEQPVQLVVQRGERVALVDVEEVLERAGDARIRHRLVAP
jgi:hypothetical protein